MKIGPWVKHVERRDYEPMGEGERFIVTAAKSMTVKVKTERGEVW